MADDLDTGHPGYAAFHAGQAKLNAAQNARTVQDWIAMLKSLPNPSAGEQRMLLELQRSPGDYEVRGGHIRKKSPLDFVGNHPFLTLGAFAGGAAAPALFGGAGAAGAGGGLNAGVGSLGAAGLPGGAMYGAAAPGAAGLSAGVGALGAAGLPGGPMYGGAAPAGAMAGAGKAGGVGGWLANQFKGLGLKDYGAIGAGIASLFGPGGMFRNNKTPGEQGLENIIGLAEGRIKSSDPLFNDLSALARDDAALARSRRASGEPILQALTAMANAQMPDYTKRG